MCKKLCNFVAIFMIYRFWTYVRHLLTAWNTTGEGVHSPYLFYVVRFLMRDENSYYCFSDIESRRRLLLECTDTLDVMDYGSAGSPEGVVIRRRVCDIARWQLERPRIGQLLFRLAVYMGQEQQRPLHLLELGTSLGITTAYLAKANTKNHVVTLEGSEAVAQIADANWRALGISNIECRLGNIDDTLYKCAREDIDLAYIDANHTYEATLRYADYLLPRLTEKGVLVIDDIHHTPEMERAWMELQQDERVTSSMDLYHVGLLFVDKHYMKRHYRIRV